ncbi:MAG: transglutaminase-like domain-containing protein [Bacteroides sp.]|nr:transglutaminase-like domain-containing protein [Bacillota bacterium]MCM1393610.1 transglutaminase-like domain-containing protein [[Eubacterium] siraeum]MCM1456094.1 transglutaminase-like domain-containing protein [Bacteroides sp.]
MKASLRKIPKITLLLFAIAIVLAVLSACNGSQSSLPSEYFAGNCITKGYTRFYLPNGTYVDREDADFGEHSYDEGTVVSTRSCTTDGETRYVCSVCNDTYSDVAPMYGHNYDEHIAQKPSCTENGVMDLHCLRCGYDTTAVIEKLNHDYAETVLTPATCTEKGRKFMKCKNCGDTNEGEIDLIPHVSDSKVYKDSEAHWRVCSVCTNIYDRAVHDNETTVTPTTCITYGHTHIECRDCGYFRDLNDQAGVLAKHSYEAYTCVVCQRDMLLEYKSTFDSNGSNERNLIEITSPDMLTCFYDYLLAYQITSGKYVKISYLGNSLTTENIDDFIADTRQKITATNWTIKSTYSYSETTRIVNYVVMRAANDGNFIFDEVATFTPNDYPSKYKSFLPVQYNSYQYENNTARPSNFDDFAYKSRLNSMNVSSSDQLFYAFEHGYKPIATASTAAYKMLAAAKTIARRIMNDEMTELEKVRAIYEYLVSDIAYDYGIVEYTKENSIAYAKCSSYYLEGVFDYKIAVCDGISKAFCVLAGLENIKCVRVTSENHAWNKVYIDLGGDGKKAWFGTDATWGNQAVSYNEDEMGEYLSLDDFLFTDAQKTAKNQNGRNYIDVGANATTEENPFKYFYFGEAEDDSCDFVITSDSELSALIAYLKANYDKFKSGEKVTVNIFIVTSYIAKDNISAKLPAEVSKNWAFISGKLAIIPPDYLTYGDTEGCSVSLVINV